jgi:hypothetical protein
MASAHLLAMRMAAKADGALSAAASAEAAQAPLYDAAAARFAGAAARLSGRFREGLLTLHRISPPPPFEPKVELFGWENSPPLPPEELERRINQAKSHYRVNYGDPAPPADGESRPSAGEADASTLAAARKAADELLAGTAELASRNGALRPDLLAHQLAAAHRLIMLLGRRADALVNAADDPLARPEARRLAQGAARLMGHFRHGLRALDCLRTEPSKPVTPDGRPPVVMVWTGPLSDWEVEHDRKFDLERGIDPETGLPMEPPPSSLPADRRGRLNNGNPGGDYLAAPRCGAKTRAGCACRQPAMANGRCRFHGGKSTGPRTAAGLARSRAARRVHGLRSADVIQLSAAAAAVNRRLAHLLSALRTSSLPRAAGEGQGGGNEGVPAGHGTSYRLSRWMAGR